SCGHRRPPAPRPGSITCYDLGVRLLPLYLLALSLCAQTGENVLLVVNKNSPVSRQIADYYRPRRSVPVKNVCTLDTTTDEEIQWNVYEQQIEQPISDCLRKAG